MTSIYVWVRTIRSLQFFYPTLDAEKVDPFVSYYEVCLEIIGLLQECDQISFDEFEGICKDKLPEAHVEAIFQNAIEHHHISARLKLLTYSVIFAGLQHRTKDLQKAARSEILLSRVSKYFGSLFKLLFQLDVGRRMQDREIIQAIGSGQGYEFLDGLFEGTVKLRHGNSNQHGVRPLSHIVPLIMDKVNSISLPFLCNEIKRHLIKDPYHIDEFSNENPVKIFSTARRTTLAHNSRRVVHLHYINKIELLRKDEFANIHLRICNDKPKASFVFAPLKCETVFLDSLMYCKWIVLGAVRGIVIVKNCQSIRISVSCDQIIVLDSRNMEIHSMSPKKPIIQNSYSITFAPFNTTYQGQSEFLTEIGHSFHHNLTLKEPINFGDGSWNLMETSKFVCQNSPLHSSEHDFEVLTNSLPHAYRCAHFRNTSEVQKWLSIEKCRISDVASNSDLLYLKSKIEKNHDEENFR